MNVPFEERESGKKPLKNDINLIPDKLKPFKEIKRDRNNTMHNCIRTQKRENVPSFTQLLNQAIKWEGGSNPIETKKLEHSENVV